MKSRNYFVVKAVAICLVLQCALSGPLSVMIVRAQTPSALADENALSLPPGAVGAEYQYQFQTEGGLAPFTWRVISGELPPGIRLEPSGKLIGAPARAQREAYSFVVEVSDDSQPPQKFAQPFLLLIKAAPLRIVMNQPKLRILPPKQIENSSSVLSRDTSRPAVAPPIEPEQSVARQTFNNATKTDSPAASQTSFQPGERTAQDQAPAPRADSAVAAAGRTVAVIPVSDAPAGNRAAVTPPAPKLPKVEQAHPNEKDLKVAAAKGATLTVFVDGLQVKLAYKDKKADEIPVSTDDEFVVTLTRPLQNEEKVVVKQSLNGATVDSEPMIVAPPPPLKRTGEIATAIVGFEQAGASAASSSQHFFFNFFISRPLPFTWLGRANGYDKTKDEFDETFGPRLKWWGNVRISSAPRQINTEVAQFVRGFSEEIGKLKVNELAQSAEFMSGLEYRLTGWKGYFWGQSEDSYQQFSLSLFGGAGAIGPLEPVETLRVFEVPPPNSAVAERFFNTYPQARGRQYIGFVSPDRDRFYRQYSAGLRLTTFYADENKTRMSSPPAMISVSLGRNELVTGGTFRGVVARLEAFYPLPIGKDRKDRFSSIYLFGSAQKRLSKVHISEPFILNPVTVMTKAPCPNPPAQDSLAPCIILNDFVSNGVTVTAPSNRDIYKIGVGVDLIRLFGGNLPTTPPAQIEKK
jgi:hypothetical protein